MPDIFISYARQDIAIAKEIAVRLNYCGFDVWWDHQLLAGDAFRQTIQRNLDNSKVVLVLWSKSSVLSRFVHDEAESALHDNRLIAIRVGDLDIHEIPVGFRGIHTGDGQDIRKIFDKMILLGAVPRKYPITKQDILRFAAIKYGYSDQKKDDPYLDSMIGYLVCLLMQLISGLGLIAVLTVAYKHWSAYDNWSNFDFPFFSFLFIMFSCMGVARRRCRRRLESIY